MSGREVRPWGFYEILDGASSYQVKRISVSPGHRLSYQRHKLRSEHWFVVEGEGVVVLEGNEHILKAGDACTIQRGALHRAANPGTRDFVFIEVQTGSYFGEDDIERLHDDYERGPR